MFDGTIVIDGGIRRREEACTNARGMNGHKNGKQMWKAMEFE